MSDLPLTRWPRALWKLFTLRPCRICGERRRCWKWHVEVMPCPTCGTVIDEFHPVFPSLLWSTATTATSGSASFTVKSGRGQREQGGEP